MRRGIILLFLATLSPRTASPQGSPLGPEFVVNTYTPAFQGSPAVAADSSGNFVVVWISLGQEGGGVASGVYGQRFAGSGEPLGPEFRVNSYTTDDQSSPAVASDAAGNFVVVWTSEGQDGSGWGIFGQRYASSGAPLGSEFRVNTFSTDTQWFPSVASGDAGQFVVVWQSYVQDGSSWGIFGQRYASSGSPLGPEFRVNTYTTYSQTYPSVAADSSGNFVVVWTTFGQDGPDRAIFGQRYASSGGPLGAPFRVNSHTTGYQINASVAADGAGDFVVVWQSNPQDGESYGVFGQRYASTGAALGPEFRVNTYTTDNQGDASVAADPASDFVVVWRSYGLQDGDAAAVIGQRYSQIVPLSLTGFAVE